MRSWQRKCVVLVVSLFSTVTGSAWAEPSQADRIQRGYQEYADQTDPSATRLSATYMLNTHLAGDSFNHQHHVGLDLTTGDTVRHHLEILYGNTSGISSVKLDPLSWGIPIRVFRKGTTLIDLEPILSFANFEGFISGGDVLLSLSSAARLQINIAIGAFYIGLVPAGFEARYLTFDTDAAEFASGFTLEYRPQVLLGFNF